MGLKLKSRTQAPPAGFLYEQRQTGWRNWQVEPTTVWDFRGLCLALQQHRLANPRYKLSTNMADIEAEVDAVNAARVAQIPGADIYVIQDTGPPSPFLSAPLSQSLNQIAAAVENLKKLVAGGATLLEWEKSGERPVSREHSERRATRCENCPKNGQGDFTRWFTERASNYIKREIARLHELKLETTSDAKLGICEVCLCPLKTKVHTPLRFIENHLTAEQRTGLASVVTNNNKPCWIIEEMK